MSIVSNFYIAVVNQFCTITTASHLYKVYALADSLSGLGNCLLHVLVTDDNVSQEHKNCRFYYLKDVSNQQTANVIIAKYHSYKDKLRWSMKPVFMNFLLNVKCIGKVIYLDNDLYFYSDYSFLFDLLDKHSIILTPHYYKYSPRKEQNWFEANFRVGLFNAGFVGASAHATETLQWWADCCAYRCEKNSFRGLFDDQKYLDLVPVIDSNAHIIRHQGCNVAGWNTDVCRRELLDEKVMINGKYPIVFIHYNETTIREIIRGDDMVLFNYYREYVTALKRHHSTLSEEDLLVEQSLIQKLKFSIWKVLTELGI